MCIKAIGIGENLVVCYKGSVSPRTNTIASHDQFRSTGIGENLVAIMIRGDSC